MDWVLKQIKINKDNIDECIALVEKWADTSEKIEEVYQAIISGNFTPELSAALLKWVQDNAVDIIGDLVHMVFFGLTMDGYFVAYIPETWDDITFNTSGYDISIPGIDFGHLTLSY